jgi:DNA-binding response OmpR family regulator
MAAHPIVLIDDDTNSAEAMAELLRDEGYDVLTAETGKGGMELLGRTDPALVLLDIHLPDVNGVAVLREFRCHSKQIPVLMVSAEDQAGTMAEAFSAGASSFLRKPISPTMLLSAVRRLTSHRS